jgi:hypothetical protein
LKLFNIPLRLDVSIEKELIVSTKSLLPYSVKASPKEVNSSVPSTLTVLAAAFIVLTKLVKSVPASSACFFTLFMALPKSNQA